MDKIKFLFRKTELLLVIILVFHVLLFITFQALNKGAQTWDSAGHINTSMRLADEIGEFVDRTGDASVITILKTSNYYPPLVQLIGAASNLAFGYESSILLYISFVFFLVSIIYTYKLIVMVSGNERIALLSAFFYSIFPQVVDQARLFHLDVPLIALLLIAVYHLFRSQGFSSSKHSLLFFVFFGLAQITKWYAWIFLVVPVVYVLIEGISGQYKEKIKQNLFNIFIGSVVFCLIALPWYIANFEEMVTLARIFSVGEVDDPAVLFSLENFLYYPKNLLTYNLLLLPYLTLLASMIYVVVKDKKRGSFYLALVFVPVLAFTFISNKNLRYILPLSPMFAYLISIFIFSTSRKLKGFSSIFIVYLLGGLLFLSFNQIKPQTPPAKVASVLFAGPVYKAWYHNTLTFYSYDPDYWPIEEMLGFIVDDANKPESVPLGISPIIDAEQFSAATIEMLRLENDYDNVFFPVPYFQFEPFSSDEELIGFFTEAGVEYIIAPDDPGPPGLRNYAALRQIVDYLASDRNSYFVQVNDYTMPGGLNIKIYKRAGLEQTFIKSGECIDKAGFVDGIESIKLEPNHTYVMFTGHFAIQDKLRREFEDGNLYILQLENTIHESILDVHNLPKSGSSLCSRAGIGLDITEEIDIAVDSENSCGLGVPCDKVMHVYWSVGDPEPVVTDYLR